MSEGKLNSPILGRGHPSLSTSHPIVAFGYLALSIVHFTFSDLAMPLMKINVNTTNLFNIFRSR